MTRRSARSLVVGTLTCLALAGFIPPAEAAIYGGIQAAGAPYSWNPGKALAATDRFLLSAWASDCPPADRGLRAEHQAEDGRLRTAEPRRRATGRLEGTTARQPAEAPG